MNRTRSPFDGAPLHRAPLDGSLLTSSQTGPSQNISNLFERQDFFTPVRQPLTAPAHSCFAPLHYESGYAYPLIVWLHGSGSSEDELRQVLPLISTRNHVAIAPRGTRSAENGSGAYRWDPSVDGIAEASQRVTDCIAIAKERFHIHPDRVFVAGHSLGGTMAYRLGLESPEQFAGAISLGGEVPRGSRLLKHINRARHLPLLLSVSPAKEIESYEKWSSETDCAPGYSIERVLEDLRFLHIAGLSLSLRLYPAGDDLTTVMFEDLNSWIMEQFCPSSTASAS